MGFKVLPLFFFSSYFVYKDLSLLPEKLYYALLVFLLCIVYWWVLPASCV